MFHARLTLNWPDHQSATAELKAESAEADYPIDYIGAVARLGDMPKESNFAFLRFKLRKLANESGAIYSEDLEGEYDRQAGGKDGL